MWSHQQARFSSAPNGKSLITPISCHPTGARMPTASRPRVAAQDQQLVDDLFRAFRATRERTVRNELVERHRWLGMMAAKRFLHRGEPFDDLEQVALLGVLKAVERFEPERGISFSSFAMPTVLGELRRHFRDTTWAVHVTRKTKELHLEIGSVTESLTHELQRPPRIHELAEALGVSVDAALQAIDAGNAYRTSPVAVQAGDDGSVVESAALRSDDDELDFAGDRMTLQACIRLLPARQQRILVLRFFHELTQAEIAAELGLSQVHVSRLLRAALAELRRAYEGAAAS
jgi:RNA polymerase sigma-B factor